MAIRPVGERTCAFGRAPPSELAGGYSPVLVRTVLSTDPSSYTFEESGTTGGQMTVALSAWRGTHPAGAVDISGARQLLISPAVTGTRTPPNGRVVRIFSGREDLTNQAQNFPAPTGHTMRVQDNPSPRLRTAHADIAQSSLAVPSATWVVGTGRGGDIGPTFSFTVVLRAANIAPNAPTLRSPVGGVAIDRAVTQRFTWTPSDPDAFDTQSKYDLRYRLVGAATYTTVTSTTPNAFHDFAPGTLLAGDHEWNARTDDSQGVVGPYSASGFFTAADMPPGPTITAPINNGTVSADPTLVQWATRRKPSIRCAGSRTWRVSPTPRWSTSTAGSSRPRRPGTSAFRFRSTTAPSTFRSGCAMGC